MLAYQDDIGTMQLYAVMAAKRHIVCQRPNSTRLGKPSLLVPLYLLWFVWLRWFWDLTSDFWAVFEEKSCKGKKAGGLWVENMQRIVAEQLPRDPSPAFRMTAKAKAKAKAKARAKAKAKANPPFDFAQGRLFGDDNRKGNGAADAGCYETQVERWLEIRLLM
jgi:hypothetical protein